MNSCCFPNEVLYPSAQMRRTYCRGDYFQVQWYEGLSRLIQVAPHTMCLIASDGNRHQSPITVEDVFAVTDAEMQVLTSHPYTYVGECR